MLEVVPYELDDIKNDLKIKAIEEFGFSDAEYEGSTVSQLINLLAYSTVINNTNFTFGLNEMFITQARDRRNVIKHARQMGYSHKRKISFQYKIKLNVLKSGEVTLSKYSNYSSNGNNYVYFGESITDIYGTFAYLKMLNNEYNNDLLNVYASDALAPNKYIISEEGLIAKVLHKEPVGDPRILLEVLDDSTLPIMSQLGQEIYVVSTDSEGDDIRSFGYRDFTRIGVIDTFITDTTDNTFRVQMTLDEDVTYPIATRKEHIILDGEQVPIEIKTVLVSTVDGDYFAMDTDTEYLIHGIETLVLSKAGEDDIEITLSSLLSNDDSSPINENNIAIPSTELSINEDHTGVDITVLDPITRNSSITSKHEVILDSVECVDIDVNGKLYVVSSSSLTISGNDVTVPEQTDDTIDTGLAIAAGLVDLVQDSAITVSAITVEDAEGNKTNIDTFTFTATSVQIIDDLGDPDSTYDTYTAEVTYNHYVPMEAGTITLKYKSIEDISGWTVNLDYNYIYDLDGYLDKKIFFSDFRGEYIENENDYSIISDGTWSGFYANKFNIETNVLYFDISPLSVAEQANPDIMKRTSGQKFHNPYVSIEGATPLCINKSVISPFRKTRFSFTEQVIDSQTQEVTGYTPFDRTETFASVVNTSVKNEIEIIVKEGTIRRWNEETEESLESRQEALDQNRLLPEPIYLNPELSVNINQDMVNASHFTIQNDDIENDGIELFVTRVLPNGSIEYDVPWSRRDYLLAEETVIGITSFVAMSDVDYEDYINIYTRYAGTGTNLSLDMTAKMNVLTSKGPLGNTNSLVDPIDNSDFEAKWFIEDTLTPCVLHIEGAEIESTDSIKDTAPKFSNTANRAVTKNDYKTICEAQQFIQSAQIWGGEEETPLNIPGNIFFSLIPYSRPITYDKLNAVYTLSNLNQPELFFPTYYQITGRNTYASEIDASDDNVLFNLLDNYKIITLQLNYNKAIYLDYRIKTRILKYEFGQTIEETNQEIFEAVREYMVDDIEKFDATFYESSLVRYIDDKLGDNYGITLDVDFSVDLYDNLHYPDEGTFTNITKSDLIPNSLNDTSDTDYLGIIGDADDWRFTMPIDFPIDDLYEESVIENNVVVKPGRLIVSNITNCNTEAFINSTDMLYMELDDGTFVSTDSDGDTEAILANSYSETVEISIMYVRNMAAAKVYDAEREEDDTAPLGTEEEKQIVQRFKVGSYWIHRTQKIIRLELNTHTHWHIDSQAVVTSKMITDAHEYDTEGDGATDAGANVPAVGTLYVSYTNAENPGDLGALLYYKVNPDTGDYIYQTDEFSDYVLVDPAKLLSDEVTIDTTIMNRVKVITLNEEEIVDAAFPNVEMPYTDTLESTVIKGNKGESIDILDDGSDLHSVIECCLPREYFTTSKKTMNINAIDNNLKLRRNVFSRFKSIEFLS